MLVAGQLSAQAGDDALYLGQIRPVFQFYQAA
jgi:hypothetical protein